MYKSHILRTGKRLASPPPNKEKTLSGKLMRNGVENLKKISGSW